MRNILLICFAILSNLLFVRNQSSNATMTPINNNTITNSTNTTTLDPRKYSDGKFYKTMPSFITEIGQNSSQCFKDLRNVIGYFSDFEQAALVLAANSNDQIDRCFDCDVYKQYLPTAIEKYSTQLSDLITHSRERKRNGFGCFLNFTLQGMEPLINSSLSQTVLSYLYYYSETNVCISKFLQDIGQVILERRRFFCTTINNMKVMALNDTNGQIVGFKWTQPQASVITNSLVELTGCINKERAIIPQTTVNAMSTIALSNSCHAIGKNVSALNATSTGPLPEGRRLMSNIRFLQTNITTIDSSNTTITQPLNTTTTISSNSTTDTTTVPLIPSNATSANPTRNFTTTTQPTSSSNTTTTVNNTTSLPVGAAGPISTNSTNTTSNNTTQPTNSGEINSSSTNTTSNNTIVQPTGSSSSNTTTMNSTSLVTPTSNSTNTTSLNSTSTITPMLNSTNTTSANTTATNFIGAAGPITVANNNTILPASNDTNSNTTLPSNITNGSNQTLNGNNGTLIILPTLAATHANKSEFLILSSTNSLALTPQSIAPAIPNLLLLTPGINQFNRYLHIGDKSTPVVINNLLNFTNEDSSIYQSIRDLANATTTKNNTLYSDLGLNLNQTLLSSYSYKCMPKGPTIFILNMMQSIPLLEEFQKSNCTAGNDHIITITNNTVNCDNCDPSLLQQEISFANRTNIPNKYFLSTGCLNGSRFKFATWKEYSGVPFASYEKDTINLNKICLKKAHNCASNKNVNDYCPQNFMTTTCRNQITNKCTASGLFSTINALNASINNDFIIPQECSLDKLANLLANQTSTDTPGKLPQSYIDTCFNWFLTNVFINAYNPNVTKLENLDTFFNTNNSTAVKTRLRILQTTANSTLAPGQSLVIPETEDPTRNDTIANQISALKFNSSSTNVDGMSGNSNPANRLDVLLIKTAQSNPNTTLTLTMSPTRPQPNIPISPPVRLASSYLNVHTMLYTIFVLFLFIN